MSASRKDKRGGAKSSLSSSSNVPSPVPSSGGADRPLSQKVSASTLSSPSLSLLPPECMGGWDDAGRSYPSLLELWEEMAERREEFYKANEEWWTEGYGGVSESETMIGDDDEASGSDLEHSQQFLEEVIASLGLSPPLRCLELGAGAGRVTRGVLLRACESVVLFEANKHWLDRAKKNIGRQRAQSCGFVQGKLEELPNVAGTLCKAREGFHLVWIQWCLQYLTDQDFVRVLCACVTVLESNGVIILKENHPQSRNKKGKGGPNKKQNQNKGRQSQREHSHVQSAAADLFQMDVPEGENQRFDITRSDEHHRLLFALAGLEVLKRERAEALEVSVWVCRPRRGFTGDLRGLLAVPRSSGDRVREKAKGGAKRGSVQKQGAVAGREAEDSSRMPIKEKEADPGGETEQEMVDRSRLLLFSFSSKRKSDSASQSQSHIGPENGGKDSSQMIRKQSDSQKEEKQSGVLE
uniref:Alpha N-terminal protein methyltransferase 1 n=1 Tax=Chromera velia CCMP2878 TaxID=1169474 RepID=A0A0G4I643_9ALVE|eukprot:Cvel_11287.t1-p1 / transcript=Cvel_11287.t1 / gene=Cvel_11287 / organism=Chromera_velia_CCMP2878 / gene_product=Alpha N-terminal protein methyltransferase 1, putative / transcript_product=Alpha N-terminal protein methyltransferase 1, putative / location=Cvel_scaffold704:59314-61269(+) / protein_length=466 / sequence_SO=supercontig / SO=protein_coding / is_pseudo=false